MRVGVLKQIVRVAVAVKVTYCSPGRISSPGRARDDDKRQCDEKWQNWYFFELS